MINVAGHLREQNGTYQMVLSWKDANGKRRTKSISTGLPVKGNKKRAESLLRQTQKEFNPETMQQVGDLSVPEYLTRWLRESVMNLSPDTYGRYAYDMGRVIIPYFERKRLSLKALTPRDLETFFRYERQQEEATVQQLLDWHRELTDALQYAVDSNWLKTNPVKTVDPCLDNSPVLFNDFLMDWLKMMKSRVAITTYANYEIVITRRIVPYFEPLHYTLQDLEQHPKYIQDFYQHELDRGVTANTVIHYHANIRKCLQYAFQIGMIRSNPADRVERPRKEKFKSEVYKAEELEQLFTAIQGDPAEFGVIMAAFYGLRRSEIKCRSCRTKKESPHFLSGIPYGLANGGGSRFRSILWQGRAVRPTHTPQIKRKLPQTSWGSFFMPVVGVEPTRVISTRDFESPSSAIPTHRRIGLNDFYYTGFPGQNQEKVCVFFQIVLHGVKYMTPVLARRRGLCYTKVRSKRK